MTLLVGIDPGRHDVPQLGPPDTWRPSTGAGTWAPWACPTTTATPGGRPDYPRTGLLAPELSCRGCGRYHGGLLPVTCQLPVGGSGYRIESRRAAFGAEATGVAPRPRFDLVRSLGVEPEIGYTGQDFAATIRPRHSCSNLQ